MREVPIRFQMVLRRVGVAWRWLGIAATIGFGSWVLIVGLARWIRFALVQGPVPLQWALADILHAQYVLDIFGLHYFIMAGPILWAAAAAGFVWGTWNFGRWLYHRLRRRTPAQMSIWVHALFFGALVFVNVLLDALAEFALLYWVVIPGVISISFVLKRGGLGRRYRDLVAICAPLAAVLFLAVDISGALAMTVWWLLTLWIWRGDRLGATRLDRLSICLAVLCIANVACLYRWREPNADMVLHRHPGGAYDFCQVPGERRVFASGIVPEETFPDAVPYATLTDYRWSVSNQTFSTKTHELFDKDIYAKRTASIVCDQQAVYVSIDQPLFHGRRSTVGILKFGFNQDGLTSRNVISQATGTQVVFDAYARNLYGTSEVYTRLERVHVDSGRRALLTQKNNPHLFAHFSSVATNKRALNTMDRTLYVVDQFRGENAHELSLPNLQWVRSFAINQGANIDVLVDPLRARLYVAGLFGLAVVDLESENVIARRRTDIGPRLVGILPEHDLLLVGMTFGRGIFLYRASDMALLKVLPLSPNTRYSLVSEDHSLLFAATSDDKFVLDTSKLVAFAYGELPADK